LVSSPVGSVFFAGPEMDTVLTLRVTRR